MAGQVLGAKAVTCPLGKWRQSRSCTTRCERESGVQKYPCPPRCNIINSSILALPCVTHLGSVKATCHNDSRYSNQVNNPLSFCAACARDRWHITLIATRWEKGRGKVWGRCGEWIFGALPDLSFLQHFHLVPPPTCQSS